MTPWAEYAAAIALGLGANSENLPVGLGYGMGGRRIGLGANLFIAAATTAATLAPLAVGRGLRGYMSERWPDILAGLLLILLGLGNAWLDRRRKLPSGTVPRPNGSAQIDGRETLLLAGALSLNNIGLGLAGGIANLGAGPVGASVAGFSILLLWLGQRLGRAAAMRSQVLRWLLLDGNILIVLVGLAMVVGA